jgi:hypothetical protein
MDAYAAAPPITILAHDSRARGPAERPQGDGGGVLGAGLAGKLSADRACIVYREETADGLTLAVTDPTHQSSVLRATVDEPHREAASTGDERRGRERQDRRHLPCRERRNYVARFGAPDSLPTRLGLGARAACPLLCCQEAAARQQASPQPISDSRTASRQPCSWWKF